MTRSFAWTPTQSALFLMLDALVTCSCGGEGQPSGHGPGVDDDVNEELDDSENEGVGGFADSGCRFGCEDGGFSMRPLAPRTVPLVDHSGWRRYAAALDPLAAHQPAVLSCPESATFVELASYEIDTTRCNYVLSEHPSLQALPPGAEVQLTLLHYDLIAPAPAEAHVGLLFADAVQWETTLAIPASADVLEARFQTTRALAAGEPIRVHLHNHGGNTYLVIALQATVFE